MSLQVPDLCLITGMWDQDLQEYHDDLQEAVERIWALARDASTECCMRDDGDLESRFEEIRDVLEGICDVLDSRRTLGEVA